MTELNLRDKGFLYVLARTATLVVLTFGISAWFVQDGFGAVEKESTKENVGRAVDALAAESAYLASKSADWANWDDTYAFMEDGNDAYVQSNLTDQALPDLDINLMLFVQPSGELLAGKAWDLANHREATIPPSLLARLSSGDTSATEAETDSYGSGLLILPEAELLYVSRPVLTSEGQGPSHGSLVMARYVDAELIKKLEGTAHLGLAFSRMDEAATAAEMQVALQGITPQSPIAVRPLDSQTIAGYTVLNDALGRPALLLRVTTPRPIYDQAVSTIYYIFIGLVVVGVVYWAALQSLVNQVKVALRAREESDERYELAVRGANDGVWDWDLRKNLVHYSARWRSMLGFAGEELGGNPEEWLGRIHPDDQERVRAELAAHIQGRSETFSSEYRMKQRSGEYLWVHCSGLALQGPEGVAHRMAGSLSDISSRKRYEEQLLHDAFHDALTGLPNRALLIDRLGQAIKRSERSRNRSYALLYLDLDHFKTVNDSLGHSTGDQLLVSCAGRLRECLRATDTAARLGGDEFAIVLEDIGDIDEATPLAERILNAMELPFELEGQRIRSTTSIGVVLGARDYLRPEQVLQDGDIAMYRAKSAGRARFAVFEPAMRERTIARIELEHDLRVAIERKEFELHYQPIVHLESDRLAGFEALLRWRHPRKGLIAPGEFLSVAEETGLILPLGDWALRQACAQMTQWHGEFPIDPVPWLSVNLSARQFAQPGLPGRIARAISETGLPARCLRLEITESTLMEDAPAAIGVLKQLKGLGVEVEIDDFGTGYSSLSYLHHFPIHALKIDRSFTNRMGPKDGGADPGADIVRTIVALARRLGLRVVAEGVETREQLADLRELKCEYGQGYFFSKPIPIDKVGTLLRDLGRNAAVEAVADRERPEGAGYKSPGSSASNVAQARIEAQEGAASGPHWPNIELAAAFAPC